MYIQKVMNRSGKLGKGVQAYNWKQVCVGIEIFRWQWVHSIWIWCWLHIHFKIFKTFNFRNVNFFKVIEKLILLAPHIHVLALHVRTWYIHQARHTSYIHTYIHLTYIYIYMRGFVQQRLQINYRDVTKWNTTTAIRSMHM